MRVVAFHNFLDNIGGAAFAFENIVVGLSKEGVSCEAYTLNLSEEIGQRFEAHGIPVSSLHFTHWHFPGPLGAFDKIVNMARAYLALRRVAEKVDNEADVLLTCHFNFSPLLHPQVRKPVVYYVTEPPRYLYEDLSTEAVSWIKRVSRIVRYIPKKVSDFIERKVDIYCTNKADEVVTDSDYIGEKVAHIYGREPTTSHPGTDLAVFKNIGLPRAGILSVGRLYMGLKGHDFVIRSMGLIRRDLRPTLTIVGEGSPAEKEGLMALAKEKGVDIVLKDPIPEAELVKLYNTSQATACAYVREPFGIVAVESLACETPVVAVSEGGLLEIVSDDSGILTARDGEEFSKALEEVVVDKKKAEDMGKAGRERIKRHFTWAKTANIILEVLERAASQSK